MEIAIATTFILALLFLAYSIVIHPKKKEAKRIKKEQEERYNKLRENVGEILNILQVHNDYMKDLNRAIEILNRAMKMT